MYSQCFPRLKFVRPIIFVAVCIVAYQGVLAAYYPVEMTGPVVLNIGSNADCFVDRVSKSYHVAREPSTIFQQHLPKLPSMENIQILCEAVVHHGIVDHKKSSWSIQGEYRQRWTKLAKRRSV